MPVPARNPVFCAIDMTDPAQAAVLADDISEHVGGFKVGLEFFVANGPGGLAPIIDYGKPVFLDLKLHDIPNTVAGAVRSAGKLGVQYLTIHASGGADMMKAAVDAAASCSSPPKILAVSVLTSMSDDDLWACGVRDDAETQVTRLAELAIEAGVQGLVCSPKEITKVRGLAGDRLEMVIPGIRPANATKGDQKRVMTPRDAMDQGADWLVIGRPITQATDPSASAYAIALELGCV